MKYLKIYYNHYLILSMCKGSIIYTKYTLRGTISYLIGIDSSCRSLTSIHIVIVYFFYLMAILP